MQCDVLPRPRPLSTTPQPPTFTSTLSLTLTLNLTPTPTPTINPPFTCPLTPTPTPTPILTLTLTPTNTINPPFTCPPHPYPPSPSSKFCSWRSFNVEQCLAFYAPLVTADTACHVSWCIAVTMQLVTLQEELRAQSQEAMAALEERLRHWEDLRNKVLPVVYLLLQGSNGLLALCSVCAGNTFELRLCLVSTK